jgi:hypothetical protein
MKAMASSCHCSRPADATVIILYRADSATCSIEASGFLRCHGRPWWAADAMGIALRLDRLDHFEDEFQSL